MKNGEMVNGREVMVQRQGAMSWPLLDVNTNHVFINETNWMNDIIEIKPWHDAFVALIIGYRWEGTSS